MTKSNSRREAAFFMPGREFWSLWKRIGICIALVCAFVLIQHPAHAKPRYRAGASHAHHVKGRAVARHRHHRDRWSKHHALPSRRPRVASHHLKLPVVNGRGDVVSIAMRYLGRGNPTGTRGPWCGDFMNFVEHIAGRSGIRSRMARDWAHYGRAVGAVPGAIAVQPHHVAIVMRRVGERIQIISGNWSHRVGIGWIALRSVIAFRAP